MTRQAGGTLLGVIVSVAVVGAGLLWWTAGSQDEPIVDADQVVKVVQRELLDAVNANGRVEPLARVAVMSRASGILKQILVEEGDVVGKGQVLAELDREQLEAELAQDDADLAAAEARVAAAAARLAEAHVGLEDPDLVYLRKEARRLAELLATGDVTESESDAAARAQASAEFRIAQVRASLPVLEASLAESQANLASSKAARERTQTALREATVRSPIDGVVLLREKEVGDGVSSLLTAGGNATQIMILGDLGEMFVEAQVDEVDLGRIAVGMPARVTVDAHRGQQLAGRVDRVAPAGTVDGNGIVTFQVRVTVEDPQGLLRPDMTADVKLVVEARPEAPALPQRALTRIADGWSVRRVEGTGPGARAVPTTVTIGLSDGLMTEVVSGLAVGDRVLLPEAGGPRGDRP